MVAARPPREKWGAPTRPHGKVRKLVRCETHDGFRYWGKPCEVCQRGKDTLETFVAAGQLANPAYVSPLQRKLYAETRPDLKRGSGRGVFGPFWMDPKARVSGEVSLWEDYVGNWRPARYDMEAVAAIVADAPPRERDVFRLYYRERLTRQECASAMQIEVSTFEKLLKRLRARVRPGSAGK